MPSKFTILGVLVAIALAAGVAHKLDLDHQALVQAETKSATDDKIIAAKEDAITERDALGRAKDADLAKLAAAIKTPQQAAKSIAQNLPAEISQPIATVDRGELPAAVQAELPDAPSYDILTAAQAIQVAKDQQTCKVATNDLAVCKLDLADRTTQLAAAKDKATVWQDNAKGGSKWHRLLGRVESAACSSAGAWVGAQVDSQNRPVGAAIGAAAGNVGCSLFTQH